VTVGEGALRPGDRVVLRTLPPGLLRGLLKADQRAIEAAVGTVVVLEGFDSNGRAELEFVDAAGHIHTIWVDRSCLEKL
jgi:hypothetical protein